IAYGMRPVALVRVEGDRFMIEITDPEAVRHERCVYAYLVGDEIVRVGSSKAPLATRLRAWSRDVTARLEGRPSPTPQREGDGWRELLAGCGGTIFARPGTIVQTPVGEISVYLDEEATLIARHRPRFCRR